MQIHNKLFFKILDFDIKKRIKIEILKEFKKTEYFFLKKFDKLQKQKKTIKTKRKELSLILEKTKKKFRRRRIE